MEDRYSSLICQHALANILNVSQWFIKLLHQPTKPHVIFCQFPNIQQVNKEAYDSIDAFSHQLKDYIGEPIARIYFRDITNMTTRYDDEEKVFFPHRNSDNQYYAQWCFQRGYVVSKTFRYDKLYHICWIWNKTIWCSLAWRINKIGLFELHWFLALLRR